MRRLAFVGILVEARASSWRQGAEPAEMTVAATPAERRDEEGRHAPWPARRSCKRPHREGPPRGSRAGLPAVRPTRSRRRRSSSRGTLAAPLRRVRGRRVRGFARRQEEQPLASDLLVSIDEVGDGPRPALLLRPKNGWMAINFDVSRRTGGEQLVDDVETLVDCRCAQCTRSLEVRHRLEVPRGDVSGSCRFDDRLRLGASGDQ